MIFIAGFMIVVVLSTAAVRSRDGLCKAAVALVWLPLGIAFLTIWAFSYRWANQSGCREAFPEYFGYRPPDYEVEPFPVEDRQTWWPLGRECVGRDSDTGTVIVEHTGWVTTMIVYPAVTCAVVALTVVVVRLSALGRRAGRARS
ncbi:hypothetical protein HQO84_20655 [Rhodococcus fascians]|uniref:hypothetical protein n=1 Tax=unclassified Rhodococcus (in: high G+C Gram-positive bacteria) TaxID=192944 RepID=UPI00040E5B27|nr:MULTISPECIES: hypothetical protein [unclassified Rhodococcus (in: high G+C Gram-positive bacteria)]MBY3988230.1 hypothetical protein [Rhodococcus fascians]MBY3997628.1 hypothetical protein [Rhodococcus fascians]MBY4004202.1 hypothetical protein [Rhodococcus fascians]MBY4008763.1 hypothetical protein [Rhodococcus fascians]MBY4018905.1 hypothetical protein [Rhodococcus fascians]